MGGLERGTSRPAADPSANQTASKPRQRSAGVLACGFGRRPAARKKLGASVAAEGKDADFARNRNPPRYLGGYHLLRRFFHSRYPARIFFKIRPSPHGTSR